MRAARQPASFSARLTLPHLLSASAVSPVHSLCSVRQHAGLLAYIFTNSMVSKDQGCGLWSQAAPYPYPQASAAKYVTPGRLLNLFGFGSL